MFGSEGVARFGVQLELVAPPFPPAQVLPACEQVAQPESFCIALNKTVPPEVETPVQEREADASVAPPLATLSSPPSVPLAVGAQLTGIVQLEPFANALHVEVAPKLKPLGTEIVGVIEAPL